MNRKYVSRAMSFALALALVGSMLPVQDLRAEQQGETPETSEAAAAEQVKEAAETEYIEISTVDEFLEFAENCYIDSWSADKWVTLKEDIDLSGRNFSMIPVFDGVFDGQGHTVSGFDYSGSGYIVGLFRYIQTEGIVENVILKGNITGTDEKECIGSLCGVNYGTIKNCSFQGTVSGRDTVGGLVGVNENTGTVTNCTVSGRVSGYYATGGVVGKNHGVLNSCTNNAGVNDNSAWVEEDDDMGVGIFFSINVSDSDTELYSGVDTGGVAGYSDGVVSGCMNAGKIGYEHTGYNIGGIAGRQAGIVSLCTNTGTVYGRKDVGGIVGQMEPFIEVDEAESLRNAVNKLHDLIDKTIDDMQAGKNAIRADFDSLTMYGDAALESGDALAGQMADFVDGNMEQTQAIVERMKHITEQLPDILNNVSGAGDAFRQLNDTVQKLTDDLDVLGKVDDSAYDETEYNRVTLLSTVGGRLRCDKSNPAEKDTVTITVVPEEGYALKSGDALRAVDANGKTVTLSAAGDNKYRFTMPKLNVKVSAEFVYTGTQTAPDTIETGSGTVPVTYALPDTGVDVGIVKNGMPGEESQPESESIEAGETRPEEEDVPTGGTRPEEEDMAAGETRSDNESVSEGENTAKEEAGTGENTPQAGEDAADNESAAENEDVKKYKITTEAGTGGIIGVANEAAAGETVYVIPAASSGYMLSGLAAKTASGADINLTRGSDGKSYSFTMPNEDVKITASFAKLQIILSSNLSGNASYRVDANGIVTLSVSPDTSYTLKGNPEVTDASGNPIPLSKKQSGSYVYEFDITGASVPCRVNITFKKQNKTNAIDTAKNDMKEAVKNLQEASDKVNNSINKIRDIVSNPDGSVKEWSQLTKEQQNELIGEVINLAEYLGNMTEAASTILSSLSTIANILEPYASDAAAAAKADIEEATKHVQSVLDSLKAASGGVKGIVNYLNAQPDIHFVQLGAGFDATKEDLHKQLQGISGSLKNLSNNASDYSDLINSDLRAVNDQLNVVFNLLADHMVDYSELSIEELYEEISDEDIDTITTGKAASCTNKGVVKGDINVGGIAGSMSVDEEDPEDNAAGSVEYQIGRRFITKCIISDSINEGYVTAKKNGAGGIVGYMRHGVVADCEGYGSVESTEGDYVGGICGESLTVIKRCYALCSVSGSKNVGGIAGYADTLKDCYTIVDCEASVGRKGAIAGQIASYGDTSGNTSGNTQGNTHGNSHGEEQEAKVCRNFYVNDELYGIDNISYVDVAEPVTYEELLTTEKLPVAFWHLKVIYRIEDEYLGAEEVKFGESLANLQYPQIPAKEGYYGVWPDYSGKVMTGNLVVKGEYKENVTVVESSEKTMESMEGEREKPYALVEQIFTEDTLLNVSLSKLEPPGEAAGKEYVIYEVSLENSGIGNEDTFAVRILNPYGNAVVWGYRNGEWSRLESKERGQYLQVDMTGVKEAFCVIEQGSYTLAFLIAAAGTAAVAVVLFVLAKGMKSHRAKRKAGKNAEE